MTTQQTLACLVPAAYLIGSIPFGLLIGLSKGVDVRTAGSGNIGASNVGRLLGKRFFFLVFLLDLLKGLLPMAAAGAIARRGSAGGAGASIYEIVLLVALAPILGHMFSVFLRFKGGKGVATSAGVVLGLWPYYTLPGLIMIAVFIVTVYVTRYISVGSIAAAIVFPLSYLGIALAREWDPFGRQLPLLLFALLVAAMITWKHRTNIARLRAGTENRLGQKPAAATNTPLSPA